MPQFPGGDQALMSYLSKHINYPPMAAENNIQGKVILQFVVEKDGKVGEVKVARSVDKDLDREAVRVVKTLPKFTPGRQNGQAVRVWYTLPVTFKLQGTN
jgi:protein TonB